MFETMVLDDVLDEDNAKKAWNLVQHGPWTFIEDMSYNSKKHHGFNQTFKVDDKVISPLFEAVAVPILNAMMVRTGLQIKDVQIARAFLQVPLAEALRGGTNGVHLDRHTDHIAAVYYLRDSDGDTVLYDNTKYNTQLNDKHVELVEHKRVTPKAGRMVLFDGARYHCSSQPVREFRAIINFNLTIR